MRLEPSILYPLEDSTVFDFEAICRTPAEAREFELTVTSGTVPADLKGALLRNGPGVEHAGQTPMHFLDGHAFIAPVRFEAGRVLYSARHVDLLIARQEQAADLDGHHALSPVALDTIGPAPVNRLLRGLFLDREARPAFPQRHRHRRSHRHLGAKLPLEPTNQ
jgi:hypothetical protein